MISNQYSVIRSQGSGVTSSRRRRIQESGVRSQVLISLAILGLLSAAHAASFDEQRRVVAASPVTQPEEAIISLLKAGLEEGKPTQAVTEAQKWLRQNIPQDAMLLYHAGRAAELSGDLKGAVALYQQYLLKADLKSATADDAVYAVYSLLLSRLNDINGAYAFGRNEGNRLMVCPRARQFDQWFLDEAVRRQDAVAVAERLTACIEARLPVDLLTARYDSYFRWLLGGLDTFLEQGFPVTQDLFDSIKDLSAAMTFNDEMKLRLDWAVSVKAYNLEKAGAAGSQKIVSSGRGKKNKSPAGKKQPGVKAADRKAAAEQAAEQKELELGDDIAPPVPEAAALLAKYPQYALSVQTGWAGGGNGLHYRNDPKKYWPHEIDSKMAPVLAAVPKLTPIQLADLLKSWTSGYYGGLDVGEVKAVRDYVIANANLMNSRTGVLLLEKPWNELTPEEAMVLAPQVQRNPSLTAALIRAKAAGGKEQDYGKIAAAFIGQESWRFPQHHDQRNAGWYGRSGLGAFGGGTPEQKAAVDKLKADLAGGLNTVDAKKEDPAAKRIAAFMTLWNDYNSLQPKLPSVYERMVKVLRVTPEVIPELLKDPSVDAQVLVRDVIAAGLEDAKGLLERDGRVRGIPNLAYSPWIHRLGGCWNGLERMKQERKDLYLPHPLEPALRASVAERLAQGKIEPWLTMAWINMQFPEDNAEQVKLMQALFKSPVWQTMPFEVQFAAREWFGKNAMTPGQIAWIDAGDSALICKDLLALTEASDVAAAAAALSKAVDGAKKSPVRMELQGLNQLAGVTNSVFADPLVFGQILDVVGKMYEPGLKNAAFAKRLLAVVSDKRDPKWFQRTKDYLWPYIAEVEPRSTFEPVRKLIESLIEDQPEAAYSMARSGVEVLSVARNTYGFEPGKHIASMKALTGRAAMKLGLMVVPVAKTDPSYRVYQSQADWQGGNEDSAWAMISESWSQLLPVHRELSMDYLMWVLQRTIYSRDEVRQEELVKALLAWAREPNTPVSLGERIGLEIAYGDIAVQRGMLKEAQVIFSRTADDPAYAGLMERYQAVLRKVRVERMAKDFDGALQTLSELEMARVPEMWAPVRYARAEVYYDMEEYEDAAKDIDSILARDMNHAEALIMQGKLQIKRQKLMEATEVPIGTVSSQDRLVPGEKLKVTLSDPTLAVSGAGTEIEVVVWATSGDRERFFLRQFGDHKTKFRGEVETALGAPSPDDRILQVTGDDEVYYAYSERFRQKMNNMEEKRGGPITVASDALLMASARRLLSEAEQRVADMEAKMAELSRHGGSAAAASAAASVSIAAEAGERAFKGESVKNVNAELEELQQSLMDERIKPGNPVYVRVIDPDRSRTAGIDEVTVSVESSSGDSIGRVTLKETGTHTGWFEGRVPTAGAQAMAFARDTEPGRNPNMVISPNTAYPAWRPVAVAGRVPEFKIDLNDNVELGDMTITAAESGARLKKFIIQTGLNDREMTTVAVYPNDLISLEKPWHPSVTVMNDTDLEHGRNERSVYDIRDLEQQLDRGWITQQYAQGVAENVAGISAAMTDSMPGKVKWKRWNRNDTSHVIYRFRGYFYEPSDVVRRFRLDLGRYDIPKNTHPTLNHPAQFMLAVDGRPITQKDGNGKLEGELALRPGVHRFEIWATGWNTSIGFGRSVKLLANLETGVSAAADPEGQAKQTMVECPDSFFDPELFPADILDHRNGRAVITAGADGTEFKVKFDAGSRARIFNIVCLGQEGPVPALNRITLKNADGKRVLPVAADYAELNKNDQLEILTGDKIAVRYVDDRYVTASKEKHERFLNVSFSDARLAFEFSEIRKDRNGDDFEYYEELLRFTYGIPVLITIDDPDMDVSDKRDSLNLTLESRAGGKKTFSALEDENMPGTFRLTVTPVAGAPAADDQIKVGEGESIRAVYRDAENVRPGIAIDRHASISHAAFSVPKLSIAHAVVTPIDFSKLKAEEVPGLQRLNIGFEDIFAIQPGEKAQGLLDVEKKEKATGGLLQPRWVISNQWIDAQSPPAGGFAAVAGQIINLEIEVPHLALRVGSSVEVYVQTDAGRAAGLQQAVRPDGGAASDAMFDVLAPGTIKLTGGLIGPPWSVGEWRGTPQIPIYIGRGVRRSDGKPGEVSSADIFSCGVPLIAGVLPDFGVLSQEEIESRRKMYLPVRMPGLVVKPGERVHVGFRYEDRDGVEKWLTASAKVITHPVFDVMEDDYRTAKKTGYVGESLYMRVVDLGADVSDGSDSVKVLMQARSGAKYQVELLEVDTHSGVFQANYSLSYVKAGGSAATNEYDVKAEGFPVVYGDVVGARYTDANGVSTETALVSISKGADGSIEPFSKKYNDADMAMRTQFALAESYLEVAKNLRELGENAAAEREYAAAKQMLAAAIEQFRDPETRAHAEYLLGNLTQEEAEATEDGGLQEERYRAALSRYMNVTGTYPDTLYASKAQFKTATVYEKLQEPEIAAQEYVKLAYKYPDSEFLAVAMARLGTHFQRKAAEYEKQAEPLLAKTDDKDAQFEGTARQKMAVKEYLKAANIFGRLLERFPDHELAGKGGLRAGQSYMRAGDNRQAVNTFLILTRNENYDGSDVRAQAMYWAGMCYESLKEAMAAYSIYKRLTFDFPESKWASYARAQLSQESLLNLETDLEMKRVEEGR